MRVIPVFFILTASAVAQEGRYATLNATLWQQTAEEYRGVCLQTFASARRALPQLLKQKKVSAAIEQTGKFNKLPPAVIFDIDETLVDNSPAQARAMLDGDGRYEPARWRQWTAEHKAAALAGGLDFVRYATSLGVTVFYVTNRGMDEEADTKANLLAAGYPLKDLGKPEIGLADTLTLIGERPEWTTDKSIRRKAIAGHYRIVMLVGDDLNDFISARTTREQRREIAKPYESRWGAQWFILPNPTYGSWESAVLDLNSKLTAEEAFEKKRKTLRRD